MSSSSAVKNNVKSAGKRTPWRREKKARAKDKRCCSRSPKADPAILSNCAAITVRTAVQIFRLFELQVCARPLNNLRLSYGRKGGRSGLAKRRSRSGWQGYTQGSALRANGSKDRRTMTRKKEDPRSCSLCTERASNLPDGRRLTLK